jgi:hypothetical protein
LWWSYTAVVTRTDSVAADFRDDYRADPIPL